MPFAGHPNVGTAFALERAGHVYETPIAGDVLTFEEIAGLVRVELIRDSGVVTRTRVAAPQRLTIGTDVPVDLIAAACTLSPADVRTVHHVPCLASCGAPFILAELASREALSAARANADVYFRDVARYPATSILIYCRENGGTDDIRARMFAPHHGIPEDPATGAANLALVGLLAHLRPERDLDFGLTVTQGIEMGRPSSLELSATKQAGAVTATYLGGACSLMLRGCFEIG